MKKSLTLSFILIISYLLVDRLTYGLLKQVDKRVFTGQITGKVNQFLTLKDSVNTLVFGSSRANHHIDVSIFDSTAYNMGVDGTKLAYAAALVETLKKKGQNILVHVDQLRMFNNKDEYTGKDCLSLINLAEDYEEIYSVIYELYPEELRILWFSKSYMYNGKALGFLKNYWKPSYDYQKYNGYDPLIPTGEQEKIFAGLMENKGPDRMGYDSTLELNPVVEKMILRIQKKCEENNNMLIFFTSPTLNHINPDLQEATTQFFKEKGILYLDYTHLFEEFNPKLWKDFTHMSAFGAETFTRRLKHDVLTHNK
ncbi:hypothetical protein [Ascidiimonas aurantiaca]|uniref:hypothetical protein n=1 Tax=Ascidiimonas aurantiaca TaxID=1685432 RepID=UPI0030ED7E85